MCQITNHATKRTKDRLNLSKRIAAKNAEKAFEHGIKHNETRGALNRYITALFFRSMNANNIRIYAGSVYIFCGQRLVTLLPLPAKFRKTAEKLARKKKIETEEME